MTFAVLHGYMAVLKTLLESRANPEGSYQHNQENTTDTPLQMASSAGKLEYSVFYLWLEMWVW